MRCSHRVQQRRSRWARKHDPVSITFSAPNLIRSTSRLSSDTDPWSWRHRCTSLTFRLPSLIEYSTAHLQSSEANDEASNYLNRQLNKFADSILGRYWKARMRFLSASGIKEISWHSLSRTWIATKAVKPSRNQQILTVITIKSRKTRKNLFPIVNNNPQSISVT